MGLLPDDVLYRKKDGFSDGVSSKERSTSDIIKDHINKLITDKEYESVMKLVSDGKLYSHCPPKTKEGYYYRKVFEETFGKNHVGVVPYYWMPRYGGRWY